MLGTGQHKAFGPLMKSDGGVEPCMFCINRDKKLDGLPRIQAIEENSGTSISISFLLGHPGPTTGADHPDTAGFQALPGIWSIPSWDFSRQLKI